MPAPQSSAQKQQTRLNLQLRELLGNAYAFVRGREYTKTIANTTYEELIDAAIEKLEVSGARPSVLDRVTKLQNEISKAVETVKSLPPSAWVMTTNDQKLDADEVANPPEG